MGDVGYISENGNVFLVGRKKEILKYQGYHVSPAELENIINEMDLVIDSCVVGISGDDGNDVTYAVVRRKSDSLTEKDVIQHVNGKVEIYPLFESLRYWKFLRSTFQYGKITSGSSWIYVQICLLTKSWHVYANFKYVNFYSLTDKVADIKKIRGKVFFVDEFPLTPSGKIIRRKLKEFVENMAK